jgi:glycosyltransferase involved in cell wall biosynthesis
MAYMKILLVHKFHFRFGGAEKIYFETAKLLEEAGHEVAFFSMHHPKNESTPWEKYFVDQVDFEDQDKSLWRKIRIGWHIIWNQQAYENITRLIEEFRPDVAHCFNVYHQLSPSVLRALQKKHIPTVLTLCDFKAISPNYFLYDFSKRQLWDSASGIRCILDRVIKHSFAKSIICACEKWLHDALGSYQRVNLFLSPSDFLIQKYRDLGFTGRMTRIHHPVIPQTTLVSSSPALPWHERPETYLFFGRLSPEKGVEVLLRAFVLLPEKRLEIVGFGPDETYLKQLADTLGINQRVIFVGGEYGEALMKRINSAKAVIMPAMWYENQPFVLMDSLQSDTPVVASDIGGIPDIVQDGMNGFLFRSGDASDLASCLSRLQTYDIENILRNAKKTAGDYTASRYQEEILSLYEEVLQKK